MKPSTYRRPMTGLKYLIPVMFALALFLVAGTSHAQAPGPIRAEVDRTHISTDEMLTLSVSVVASMLNAPRPALPSLQGFDIVGTSTSSQMSIVNGEVSSQVVYHYRLQPYETGELTIEPISVTLHGQTFSTEPITVQVTQGTGVPPATGAPAATRKQAAQPVAEPPAEELAGQDLYVEALVDNRTPFVGEQVTYTFRFYQAVNLWDQPQYEAPTFQGFWIEHQSDPIRHRVQAAGRIYEVTELQTILFPSVIGPVTIEPAALTIPGSLFRSGTVMRSNSIALDVRALPAGAPEGFAGAVGAYSLSGTLDTTQGTANEPLTWQVTLAGRGNVSAAPDPNWPELATWRSFESEATVQTEVQDGKVVGTRSYERFLVPTTDGAFTIPALTYAYFDPSTEQYQVASTDPEPVSISRGADEPPTTYTSEEGQAAADQESTAIRHLKPVPSRLGVEEGSVTQSSIYWAAWAFPLVGAAGYFVWQRRQRFWENNRELARSSLARKNARKAMARALRDQRDAYSTARLVLNAYLADKLNQPVAGLTHQALAERLAERGVGPDLIDRVEVILVGSELGRFAPGADDPDHANGLLKELNSLINALEKAL
jgi:hypothetical protein